jgi:prevent-host-death family protein
MHAGKNSTTQTVKASDARQHWSELLNEVFKGRKRVIVEKSGIPVAAVISAEDLERLERFEAQRRERFRSLEETWAAFDDVDPEELERHIAEAVEEVRAEHRSSGDSNASSA